MKLFSTLTSTILLLLLQVPVHASDADLLGALASDNQEHLLLAGRDGRQDRRQERGRSDERQDKRDCRQDEGRVGQDKRECKQEEVRDGVRGNKGGRLGGDDD
jgi:hypothetical protein